LKARTIQIAKAAPCSYA